MLGLATKRITYELTHILPTVVIGGIKALSQSQEPPSYHNYLGILSSTLYPWEILNTLSVGDAASFFAAEELIS